jgi:ATPase family associated with various cellular activities (AAA)
MFSSPIEHLRAELQRLDLLLHREILHLRAAYQLSLDEFRGLYISNEQVDQLVQQQAGQEGALTDCNALTRHAEAMRRANAAQLSPGLPWVRLIAEFGLSPLEADALLLAIAPEIDSKYETLYAYLNNDITRKFPTYDLALRVLSAEPEERLQLRAGLLPGSNLFTAGLLVPGQATADRLAWLSGGFGAAAGVAHHLLGLPAGDPRLAGIVERRQPAIGWDELPLSLDLQTCLRRLPALFKSGSGPLLVFEGQHGSGRRLAAEATCAALGLPLLRVNLATLRAAAESWPRIGPPLVLQTRLAGAGLYLDRGEALLNREGQPLPEGQGLLRSLAQLRGPVFLACPSGAPHPELLSGVRYLIFPFADPDHTARRRLWAMYSAQAGCAISGTLVEALADRFVLTPGQIQDTVAAALDHYALVGGSDGGLPDEELLAAARAQSDQSLGKLAVKVASSHTWDELVLAPVTLRQIKAIAAAIKNQHVVYSSWGFERRIASGKGLKVLFAGASGTGKTMTAGVIARDLGLDLYKIDLSGIVSKYIGETEKNLDRIFQAARSSNAILFFDEADALFGKRSEVKDAHDRYANIEVAYLLQKVEEHAGPVILASNLSKNIDQAFARRMHYVIEFPLPDETHRERLWRGMFPAQTPLAAEVDLAFLAKQFAISGGDIQNVALDAAFLAAEDGRVIAMKHLAKAMARQMVKQGRIPSATDLKQYYPLLAQE